MTVFRAASLLILAAIATAALAQTPLVFGRSTARCGNNMDFAAVTDAAFSFWTDYFNSQGGMVRCPSFNFARPCD